MTLMTLQRHRHMDSDWPVSLYVTALILAECGLPVDEVRMCEQSARMLCKYPHIRNTSKTSPDSFRSGAIHQ